MSNKPKDFAYYADKAEQAMQGPWSTSTQRERDMQRAELYVRLAAAAPKAEPEPKSNFFYFVNGQRVEGQRCFAQRFANPLVDPSKSQCTRNQGHGGPHKTANGAYFETEQD